MQIIDRYVLRYFLSTLAITFVSLAGLYFVVDALTHFDDFSSRAAGAGQLLRAMGEYYSYRSLAVWDRASGMLVLIAALLTMTSLRRHQELTALMASGIPKLRVVRSVLVTAVVLSVIAAGSREWLLPRLRHELLVDASELAGHARAVEPVIDGRTDITLNGESIDARERVILHPRFLLPDLTAGGSYLVAETAVYLTGTEQLPAGYRLMGVDVETLQLCEQLDEPVRAYLRTAEQDERLEAGELFVEASLTFEQLAAGNSWRSYASLGELRASLRPLSIDGGASARVAIHGRIVQPFNDLLLLLIGMPLFLGQAQRNAFLAAGQCMLVVALFQLVALSGQFLGTAQWISPALGAWLPLIGFGPIAIGSFDVLRS